MTSFIFKWIGFWKKIWISFGKISNSKLYATQWYSWGKIRWLLQLCEIGVGSYNESSWKSFESALKPSFKFWVLNLNFKLWHVGNISKTKPDKYLIKSMRGANMTLQKTSEETMPKDLDSNLKFIWIWKKNRFLWSLGFAFGKMFKWKGIFPWSFGYIYTLYKIFIDLVLFLF